MHVNLLKGHFCKKKLEHSDLMTKVCFIFIFDLTNADFSSRIKIKFLIN